MFSGWCENIAFDTHGVTAPVICLFLHRLGVD